jgi:lipopolysaccharide transport system permease protein
VDIVFSVWPGVNALMVLPALLLWVVDALALTLLLGGFCARFRDVMPIVNSVMQIAFFITPVIWKPQQLGARGMEHLPLNPFFDMLEIVRAPLLGAMPDPMVWIGAGVYSVLLCALSWTFFSRARGRLAYWL